MFSYHPANLNENTKASYFSRGFRTWQNDRDLQSAMLTKAWSPVVYKDGRRLKANFLQSNWFALDFDDGEMRLEEACKTFCDTLSIIGTTKSHTKERHRFRVVLFSHKIVKDRHQYEYNLKKLIDKYPCDPAAKDAARFFWPCKEIIQVVKEGYSLDVYDLPENYGVYDNRKTEAYGNALVIPPKARQILSSKLYETGNRNSEVFKCSCFMARAGFSPEKIEQIIIASKCCNLERDEIHDVVGKAVKTVRKGQVDYVRTE